MPEHNPNDAILGTFALFGALCRHLTNKGLMSPQELKAVVDDAIADVGQHERGATAVAFIKEAVGAD